MLIAQDKTYGNAYYDRTELWPGLSENINYLPEYFIDIGDPIKPREMIGTYFWKRLFSKGEVYVNADSTPKTIQINVTEKLVTIKNVTLAIAHNTSAGDIFYENITSGTDLTLQPATAVILQYYTNETECSIDSDCPPDQDSCIINSCVNETCVYVNNADCNNPDLDNPVNNPRNNKNNSNISSKNYSNIEHPVIVSEGNQTGNLSPITKISEKAKFILYIIIGIIIILIIIILVYFIRGIKR